MATDGRRGTLGDYTLLFAVLTEVFLGSGLWIPLVSVFRAHGKPKPRFRRVPNPDYEPLKKQLETLGERIRLNRARVSRYEQLKADYDAWVENHCLRTKIRLKEIHAEKLRFRAKKRNHRKGDDS